MTVDWFAEANRRDEQRAWNEMLDLAERRAARRGRCPDCHKMRDDPAGFGCVMLHKERPA